MPLSFNTAGPCIPGEHYMLPPERRLARVQQLIEDRRAMSWLGTTSPFNITAEATTLGPFTEAEVEELCREICRET